MIYLIIRSPYQLASHCKPLMICNVEDKMLKVKTETTEPLTTINVALIRRHNKVCIYIMDRMWTSMTTNCTISD